ncbi:MAG: hybrid sensor histidine kinase/response regulator [Mycobacteriales bacterium]
MTAWGDDPELLATFRAEVEERLASLQAGLLQLEGHSSPRQVVAGLFRDAHTVKGSARMLGLGGVLRVSHAMEDLLGALRDGRFAVRRDLVDLLLGSCDAIARALPGGELTDGDLEPVLLALAAAVDGQDPVAVPVLRAALTVPAQPTPAPAQPTPAPARLTPAPARLTPAPAQRTPAPPAPAPPPPPTPVAAPTAPPAPGDIVRPGSDSVRVAAGKLYELLDVVGEADLGARRIEQSTAGLLASAAEQARWAATLRSAALRSASTLPPDIALALHRMVGAADEMSGAVRGLRELAEGHRGGMALVRDGAMGLAMVPVRRAFAALPRIVRDVAQATGKTVRLETAGEDVEIDKQVLDGVAEALKHLVVNAVDHGCEDAATRVAAGKPAEAVVRVTARGVAGTVVLEVSDDGAGVDEERARAKAVELGLLPADSGLAGSGLLELLFAPAFSTAGVVTETSGRGVGLDVVRDAVDQLGGSVEVRSERGAGTAFVLTLPVTLGVLRCLLARVGDERYAVPVPGVVESLSLRDAEVHILAGATVVVRHGVSIPLLDLGTALGLARLPGDSPGSALVVRHAAGGGSMVAWAVDRLEGESELVVKDLGDFLGRVPAIAGATIDGDGSVVCLLDLRELAERAVGPSPALAATVVARAPRSVPTAGTRRPRVLVVEDSVGVRELQRVILEGAGYAVETAVDGLDGAARLRDDPADLVLSDVEMPGMDGFDLTRTIRRTKGWENVPVIIMTSRGEEHARQAGLDAGCSAYLLKSEFDEAQLVSTVRRLVGR